MDKKYLDSMKLDKLRDIAKQLDVNQVYKYNKDKLKDEILQRLIEFENFEKNEKARFRKISTLGTKGKDASTYLVQDKKGVNYALKQYRKNKSINTITNEIEFQTKANKYGISPKIHYFSEYFRYTVMDKLDFTLFEVLKENKGELSDEDQTMIVDLIYVLDRIGIFHGDPNLGNFMVNKGKKNKWYIIDFGFSKKITPQLKRKYGTKTPNKKFMIIGILLKIKEIAGAVNLNKYKIFKKHLTPDDKRLFQL
tara:strand:- start:401 stop:1156 length:756 start_codon:yes stop_codon:yes gene_type:complete